MKKLNKNELGLGAVELIIILVVVILIGVAGWFVYARSHNKTSSESTGLLDHTTPLNSSSNNTAAKTVDPYAGWKSYTLKYEKLTFKYPSTWTLQDYTGQQGLSPNTDSLTMTSISGFSMNIDDGWDGSGDSLRLATDSTIPVKFIGNDVFLVFGRPKTFGTSPSNADPNSLDGAVLMTKPSTDYGQNNTVGYFPQDKNAHGDPNINNGGSTTLISAGYSTPKTFATVSQAKDDAEFKNTVLVLQSMHY